MLAVDDPSATDDDTKSLISKQPSNATESKSTIKKKKRKTFYQWLWSNPLSKLPFIYFVVGLLGVAALAVFHFMDPDTSYIICGGYIVLNIFGIKHFYTLIGLKKVTYGCMFLCNGSKCCWWLLA
eukprot:268032_1